MYDRSSGITNLGYETGHSGVREKRTEKWREKAIIGLFAYSLK
jgi:hypothetical protein